jgi:DNA integrity scanning protein DisA with diadenylate cyclase activity
MPHKIELQARALVLHLGAPQTSMNLEKVNLLIEAGYGTISKLRAATDEELLAIPGIEPATVKRVREYITALGG